MQFKFPSILAAAFVVLALLLLQTRKDTVTASGTGKAESNSTLKDFLKKWIVNAEEINLVIRKRYHQGSVSFNEMSEAQMKVFRVKLELSDTKVQRLEVLREMVEAANNLLKTVKKQHPSHLDVLQAEAQLLDSQIALERAKSLQ